MISYRPLWETLKKKNISQYQLINQFGVDNAQLHRLRNNEVIKTITVDRLCRILGCKVEDIMEYVEDESSPSE